MTIAKTVIAITIVGLALSACSATQHSADVQAANDVDGITWVPCNGRSTLVCRQPTSPEFSVHQIL